MTTMFSSTSRVALLAAAAVLSAPLAAEAQTFTVPSGQTVTQQQTVYGVGTSRIEPNGTLDVDATAIIWNGNAADPDDITIVNDGTVLSNDRAIDTTGTVNGKFRLENNGTITTSDADLFRINNTFTGGEVTVVNHGDMTSGDGQALDFDKATGASKVTIENASGGNIIGQNGDAIRLGGGDILITNSGTIEGDGGSKAISFDNAANIESVTSFKLVNEEGGEIIGTDDAIKINANSGSTSHAVITIENHGLIDGGEGQALDFDELNSPNNIINITNYGRILSQTADGMRPGNGATITNYGLIQSVNPNNDSDGDGIDFQAGGGTVFNKDGGQIIGAKHGITGEGTSSITNDAGGEIIGRNGSGINFDTEGDELVTVVNHGLISGQVTHPIDDDGDPTPDGDGDGVDVDGKVLIHNYGTIEGTGASGTNDGLPNTADGIAIGGGTIYNYKGGVIRAYDDYPSGDSSDVGRAILVDDSNQGAAPFATSIFNEGTITSDGVAITLIGTQNDVIENSGLIHSDDAKAVDMGGGNDRFTYVVGSEVDGYVTGGADFDELELKGAGSFSASDIGDAEQYRSFELLSVRAGSNFIVTGTSTALSNVEVGGTLILEGDLGKAATLVQNGGLLAGGGFTGATTVEAGGVISPGVNSIDRLTVASVAFEAGSFYDVDINLGSSDQIVTTAAGSTVSDGAVVRLASDGGPLQIGKTYTIVDFAAGQQAAQFGGVEHDFLFIDPVLGNAPVDNDITLTLDRNDRRFADVANTRNQAAVANAIENAANTSALYQHLVSATDEDTVRSNYDSLSGEAHASLGTVLFSQNTLVTDTIASRLRQAPAGTNGALAALGADGPATAYATKAPEYPAFKAVKAPAPGPIYATWAQGFGQWFDASSDGNAAKVDATVGGFLAGADVTLNNFTFGLAGGYSTADSDVDGRSSSVDADTVLIAAYAGASFDAFKLRAGGSYGWSDIDSHRTAVVGNIVEKPTASYDGNTASLFGEAAYAFQVANAAFEPFAQIAWSQVQTDGFTEKNAPITGLTSGGLDFDTTYSTLGARVATTFDMSGAAVTPHASLAWRHAFDGVTPEMAVAFSSTGTAFSVAGTPIAEDSLVVGAGIDVGIGKGLSLNINYEGQFADEAEYNAVKGGFAYRF